MTVVKGPANKFKRKHKVLMLSTRGINYRYRHLLNDLGALLAHSKKDAKLDTKTNFSMLNEVADLQDCDHCFFFETRKKTDLYLWCSVCPTGPSIKFLVQNVHTSDELKLVGNCLKGSRPIVSFDPSFDASPHWRLVKAVLSRIFSVPIRAKKMKPFIDHVLNLSIVDDRIWFRNYQIVEKDPLMKTSSTTDMTLEEIGPRFVLQPIRIFQGSFQGSVLWDNPKYISPNQIRSSVRLSKAKSYGERKSAQQLRQMRQQTLVAPKDELDEVFE